MTWLSEKLVRDPEHENVHPGLASSSVGVTSPTAGDELALRLGGWHGCLDDVGGRPLACTTCQEQAAELLLVYRGLARCRVSVDLNAVYGLVVDTRDVLESYLVDGVQIPGWRSTLLTAGIRFGELAHQLPAEVKFLNRDATRWLVLSRQLRQLADGLADRNGLAAWVAAEVAGCLEQLNDACGPVPAAF